MNVRHDGHFHKLSEPDGRIGFDEDALDVVGFEDWHSVIAHKHSPLYWLVAIGSVAGIVALVLAIVILILG